MKTFNDNLQTVLPAYAECGGLMYLSQNIRWQNEAFDMVGTVPGNITVESRPQGRGYVVLQETGQGLWPAQTKVMRPTNRVAVFQHMNFTTLDSIYKAVPLTMHMMSSAERGLMGTMMA